MIWLLFINSFIIFSVENGPRFDDDVVIVVSMDSPSFNQLYPHTIMPSSKYLAGYYTVKVKVNISENDASILILMSAKKKAVTWIMTLEFKNTYFQLLRFSSSSEKDSNQKDLAGRENDWVKLYRSCSEKSKRRLLRKIINLEVRSNKRNLISNVQEKSLEGMDNPNILLPFIMPFT